MKKLFSLLLAVMMLAMPVLGSAETMFSAMYAPFMELRPGDFGILTDVDFNYYKLYNDALEAGREIQSEVSIGKINEAILGDEETATAVNDLLSALEIKASMQANELSVNIGMSGNELLTIGYAQDGTDAYLSSNLLGGTVVIGEDELIPVIERILDVLVMMEAIPEDEAAEVKAQLPQMLDMIVGELANVYQMPDLSAFENLDITPINEALAPIIAKAETVTDFEQPADCDAATSMVTVNVTGEDAASVLKSLLLTLKANPALMNAVAELMGYGENSSNMQMYRMFYGESFTFESMVIDPAIESMDEEFEGAGAVLLTLWLDAAGEVVKLTAANAAESEAAETAAEETPVVVELEGLPEDAMVIGLDDWQTVLETENEPIITYTRVTDGAPIHTVTFCMEDDRITMQAAGSGNAFGFDMNVTEDGESIMALSMMMAVEQQADQYSALLTMGMEADGESFVLSGVTNVKMDGVDFEVVSNFAMLYNGDVLFEMTETSKTVDPTATIVSEDAVRLATIEDEEFANWFVRMLVTAQMWGNSLPEKLPASVQELMVTEEAPVDTVETVDFVDVAE